jgi:hypothetical protein
MNRLKKELQPKFKKAAKIRDLSNSESISFSVTSFAQIVDWILTFGVA